VPGWSLTHKKLHFIELDIPWHWSQHPKLNSPLIQFQAVPICTYKSTVHSLSSRVCTQLIKSFRQPTKHGTSISSVQTAATGLNKLSLAHYVAPNILCAILILSSNLRLPIRIGPSSWGFPVKILHEFHSFTSFIFFFFFSSWYVQSGSFRLDILIPFFQRPLSSFRYNVYCRISFGILPSVVMSRWFIKFCLSASILCVIGCVISSFLISSFPLWSSLVQPLNALQYLISTDCFIFTYLASFVQDWLPYGNVGSATALENCNCVSFLPLVFKVHQGSPNGLPNVVLFFYFILYCIFSLPNIYFTSLPRQLKRDARRKEPSYKKVLPCTSQKYHSYKFQLRKQMI
jgi:hypothetical protein